MIQIDPWQMKQISFKSFRCHHHKAKSNEINKFPVEKVENVRIYKIHKDKEQI